MNRRKVNTLFCILGLAATVSLTFSWSAGAGADGTGHLSPAGSWVAVDVLGATTFVTTVPLDPSDSRYAMVADDFQGSPDFFGLFPTVVARTQFRGELIRTGTRTGQATLLAAATDADQNIVYFMVVSGTIELTGPDGGGAVATLAIFGAAQDPFGEDPPEYGCYPYQYTLERMPVSPPCGP